VTPRGRRLAAWLIALGGLHLLIICAGFFAPYDPLAQNRERPYASPTRLHFIDRAARMHLRPFFYASSQSGVFVSPAFESNLYMVPLQFFVTGARYRILGVVPLTLHLFGAPESHFYLLGSDAYGRDLFSRILYGAQISLLAGLLGATLTLLLGLSIGAAAGYLGGWKDDLLMRFAELFLALPWLYLLFALRAFLPLTVSPGEAFFLVTLVIGVVGWARPARMIRGIVLSAKERDFVRAARGFGASHIYLLRRHILPQTSSVLLTQAAVLVPQFVLAEVTLSFLGLGVPEPVPSWGNLLASLQQYSVLVSYWWMYFPALVMVPFFLGYLGLASFLQHRSSTYRIELTANEELA
jgi:peptide/nickel transport system permease protein